MKPQAHYKKSRRPTHFFSHASPLKKKRIRFLQAAVFGYERARGKREE